MDGLKPWRKSTWCIPPEQDAGVAARMEQVLDVYSRPYDARRPVVCMDEQPYQLLSETGPPLPMEPGNEKVVDHEYAREGSSEDWMFMEPTGRREVPVSGRRPRIRPALGSRP